MHRLIFILITCFGTAVHAAVTNVPPGEGTLRNAIAAAADGDTLILSSGIYTFDNGSIFIEDKSLTIRALGASTDPIIRYIGFGRSGLEISGVEQDIQVALQGLVFDSCNSQSPLKVVAEQRTSLVLLENDFRETDIDATDVSQFIAIGNRFNENTGPDCISGSFSSINALVNPDETEEQESIFAGNVIAETIIGSIFSNVHVLGNRFSCQVATIDRKCATTSVGDVIGNHFGYAVDREARNMVTLQLDIGSGVSAPVVSIVANNVFDHSVTATNQQGNQQGEPVDFGGVTSVQVEGSDFELRNNVFDYSGVQAQATAAEDVPVLDVRAAIEMRGNIIHQSVSAGGPRQVAIAYASPAIASDSVFANNLCFESGTTCGTSNGNLDVDPQFAEFTNFTLGAASPAINAGPIDATLSDIDLSRNDMGVHGGPLPYQQFIDQINNSNEPYTYPLLVRDKAFTQDGVGVHFFSAARMR
jgi:hypothetical protein